MGRLITSSIVISLILSAFSGAVSAQSVFTDNFDGGNLGTWQLIPDPQTSPGTTSFNMDGNPTTVAGTGLPYNINSAMNSLNYNSDQIPYNYDVDNSTSAAY